MRSVGTENFVTYKGPVLDRQVKTRREIEVPIGPGTEAAAQFREILKALGFREVRAVEKRRTTWRFRSAERDFELTLDEVTGLGLFVEIETLGDLGQKDAAQNALLELARKLNFGEPERMSYLELLLAMDARGS
jgi:adenylate cyclase class 2